jgi:hypothetical protein
MAAGTDSAGNSYVELDMSDNEQIRLTSIRHQDWADGPTIRIQKRAHNGRVSPGTARGRLGFDRTMGSRRPDDQRDER